MGDLKLDKTNHDFTKEIGNWIKVAIFLAPALYVVISYFTNSATSEVVSTLTEVKTRVELIDQNVRHLRELVLKDTDNIQSRLKQHDTRIEHITDRLRIVEGKVDK